jgi:hypothetical protein
MSLRYRSWASLDLGDDAGWSSTRPLWTEKSRSGNWPQTIAGFWGDDEQP